MNNYYSKEDFFKMYEKYKKQIVDKENALKIIEENELHRIVVEFDHKNYDKKYQTDCATVLASLFGAF